MYRKRTNTLDVNKLDRLQFIFLGVIVLFVFIVLKLFYLQIVQNKYYLVKAKAQHSFVADIKPKRGEIFLRNNDKSYPLVINKVYFDLYAIPNIVENPQDLSKKLSEILGIEEEILNGRLSKKDDIYEPIKNKLTDEEYQRVNELNSKGLGFIKENYRHYPDGPVGSHIVGFVGYKDDKLVGSYGLEGYWENELKGQEVELTGEKDAYGNFITIGKTDFKKVTDGNDLYLTIDQAIQNFVCKRLKEATESYGARNGTVIVMNPKNGDILAMCNYPEFDPNNYSQVENQNFYNNNAIFTSYEPGSVFKVVTMAMGLDLGIVKPETTYIDTGILEVDGFKIRNSDKKANGIRTMVQVLDESLNTGAAFVAEKVGRERFLDYATKFGFGQKTNIDLNVEVKGNIENLNKKGKVFLATASFGQGITATPIQLISSFAAFVNGGYLYKPRIVEKIVHPNGKEDTIETQFIRKVISDKAAKQISAMLVSVVEQGHAKSAKSDKYYLGGKTGTAQIAGKGGYVTDRTNHTFIGFGPSRDPRFVIFVKFDSPQRAWAESSAGPVFKDIADFILDYYKIQPEK
ncbi:MAG: penicillin-binding protein 2 [Patescibacteria group bacterium]|nr:penicillin-binding protein 2 [Patescibacteria group bacterium]MDD4304675.1 penicillin-binding protein 2 [Patescibacteria group bacterium]MDD4695357.1 penicillin-binding protein 2 [Patescibacteria group bacterium]